jgi:hypothetical protein
MPYLVFYRNRIVNLNLILSLYAVNNSPVSLGYTVLVYNFFTCRRKEPADFDASEFCMTAVFLRLLREHKGAARRVESGSFGDSARESYGL